VETPLQTAVAAAYYVETVAAAVVAAVVLVDIAAALSGAAPVPAAGNKVVAGFGVSADHHLDPPATQERWMTTTNGCLQLGSVVEVDAGNAADVKKKTTVGVVATSHRPSLRNYSYQRRNSVN
jgi:hypothetical protein